MKIGSREAGFVPGWWSDAEVDGTTYRVGILAIPTSLSRPDTWGVVRNAAGKVLWQERVPASVSARELLRLAGILE